MADSEQPSYTQSYSEQDSPETVQHSMPIAIANHYLLLFALVLPFALTGIFEFLSLDAEQITGLLQFKLMSFGILLICLIPYAKTLFKNERFRTAPALVVILWALLYNVFAVGGTNLFITAFFPEWLELTPTFAPTSSLEYILLPIVLALIVPLEEELVFRGILLNSYERLLSPQNAFIAVSAIFALVHIAPSQVLIILPTCFIITRAVQYSNSIWTGVIIHMFINSIASLAMLMPTPEETAIEEGVLTPSISVSPVVGILGLLLSCTIMWIMYRNWGFGTKTKPEIRIKEVLWTISLITVVGMCAFGFTMMAMNPSL